MKYTSNSFEETQNIAGDFMQNLSPRSVGATVVGLYGNLGAGKTSFTQSVAKALGVEETVTSPTFVIEKIYELSEKKFEHLIHIDAYRLQSSDELLKLGWQSVIADRGNLILIEWPERVQDIMPEHIKINLELLDSGDSREINIEGV